MATAEVAIFLPSLNRPHKLRSLIENVHDATPEPHKLYFIVCDSESVDILQEMKESHKWGDGAGDLLTWVQRNNYMYKTTYEPYMFLGSDDLYFHDGWFSKAMETMNLVNGVVPVNDLHNPNGTSALVSRYYVKTMSGCIDIPDVIVNPNYHHNFADTELFATAEYRGRKAYSADSVVEHMHPSAGKAEHDATYQRSDEHWAHDEALFNSRKYLWS